jgi:hypothetical protein
MALNVHNAERFAKHIEQSVNTLHISYMDAIIQFCQARQVEPEAVAPFISAKIKDHLAREARAVHLLRPSNSLLD